MTANIHYYDIGDHKTRKEKLDTLRLFKSAENVPWTIITPNSKHDWINQRSREFDSLVPMISRHETAVFEMLSNGLKTGRDRWCYNFSLQKLTENMQRMIAFYNEQVREFQKQKIADHDLTVSRFITYDRQKISWDSELQNSVKRGISIPFQHQSLTSAMYRPFCKMHVYFNRHVNQRTYQMARIFPMENSAICIPASGAFCCFMTDTLPDLGLLPAAKCFPYWVYDVNKEPGSMCQENAEWPRRENITDTAWKLFQKHYHNNGITKSDIFYYVYGVLHAPEYRQKFQNELKKQLPRIPLVRGVKLFRRFSEAGKKLADLHVHYETGKKYPLKQNNDNTGNTAVVKMKFASATDKSKIIYNNAVTISGIPDEAHRYLINGRSALDWLLDRYQIKKDKNSGIVNDPNDRLRELHSPQYIIELIQRVVFLSTESVKIIEGLPEFGNMI
ncbi:MAG: hypothetical protein LBH00_08910 [Planctomycetaceae bacterium]|jgi:predicted helicase|nr:hypothetical protein [Planctomycetaceae bacterium]